MTLLVALSLFTAFCTACACWFAYVSAINAEAAHDSALDVRKRTGKLDAAVEDIAALSKRLGKLAGRFYRELRDDPVEPTPEPANIAGAPCENWASAQREGPQSEAASCECTFCQASRAARARVKAALTPKSQADRIKSMRDGLSQP